LASPALDWPWHHRLPQMVASPPHASLKFSLILCISLGFSFFFSWSLSNLSRLGREEMNKKEERKGREKGREKKKKKKTERGMLDTENV
jgi:hypothetical protein